ncbi:hypothetical protein EJ02DRAFT_376074 [Clathrospora elynae]|uniref:Mitochondrial intermembrane space import and assembly protein 40 n=1 Tax=Clathrospora elynae TaxID=706981 RepID=A0A6A5SUK0_9PLEO|nr:hypothetical protein EJ02DRAFT_376074 [Clathrospora elynae]
MFRAAPRLIARPVLRIAPLRSLAPPRRPISTAPPTKKARSIKSLVARLGIAGAIIYYYNTTDLFAEEPRNPVQALPETEVESEYLPTIESLSEERKRRQAVQAQIDAQQQKEAASRQQNAKPSDGAEGGIEGLEEEAGQQGAFNPETGEINWDCPCLGGMADGPCGEQFKEAFSCFVFSTEEPKGMDCIDKFKHMQDCFREYPEIYGSELDSDADDEDDMTADDPSPQPMEETPTRSAPAFSPSRPDATSSNGQSELSSQPRDNDQASLAKGKFSGEPNSKPQQSTEKRRGVELVPGNYRPDGKEKEKDPMVDARGDVSSLEKPKGDGAKGEQDKKSREVSESDRLVPKAAHDAEEKGTQRLGRK